jgi:hypothetical protein
MSLLRLNTEPSRKQLLVFGLLWLFVGGLFGGLSWFRERHTLALLLWVAGPGVSLFGFLFPPWLRWVYVGMTYVTFPIGFVISQVILASVYYFVLTPIGLCMRLFRYDPLSRRFDPKLDSYWTRRPRGNQIDGYFRQN